MQRFLRFGIVGGSAVVLDMTLLHFLAGSHFLGWNIAISKILAAEIAMLSNFSWDELWTFRHLAERRKGPAQRFARLLKFNLRTSS